MKRYERGEFRLTGLGKLLLIVVGLAVIGYAFLMYRDRLPGHPREQAADTSSGTWTKPPGASSDAAAPGEVSAPTDAGGPHESEARPSPPPSSTPGIVLSEAPSQCESHRIVASAHGGECAPNFSPPPPTRTS